eukprot:309569_1
MANKQNMLIKVTRICIHMHAMKPTHACPPNQHCTVLSIGIASANKTHINCTEAASCDILCENLYSCTGAVMDCPTNGDCNIMCNGVFSCEQARVHCEAMFK